MQYPLIITGVSLLTILLGLFTTLFRYPQLLFLCILTCIEFIIYVIIRQNIYIVEIIQKLKNKSNKELRKNVEHGLTVKKYQEWLHMAQQLDIVDGYEQWKYNDNDPCYDQKLIRYLTYTLHKYRIQIGELTNELKNIKRVSIISLENNIDDIKYENTIATVTVNNNNNNANRIQCSSCESTSNSYSEDDNERKLNQIETNSKQHSSYKQNTTHHHHHYKNKKYRYNYHKKIDTTIDNNNNNTNKIEEKSKCNDNKKLDNCNSNKKRTKEIIMRELDIYIQQIYRLLCTSIQWNVGGVMKEQQYSITHSGTPKYCITEFFQEIQECIKLLLLNNCLPLDDISRLRIQIQLQRISGTTAQCLSGGGSMGLYHLGVVKSLLEMNMLPNIITGASAGAFIAAHVCCHTNNELHDTLKAENFIKYIYFDDYTLKKKIQNIYNLGYMCEFDRWINIVRWHTCGDMTFLQAYEKTGRILIITVTSNNSSNPTLYQSKDTTPNIVIWSSIFASASLAKIFPSITLLERDDRGNLYPCKLPYVHLRDGSYKNDIPKKCLSQIYNVTFNIVSQTNPHIIPFFYPIYGAVGRIHNIWPNIFLTDKSRYNTQIRGGYILTFLENFFKLNLLRNCKIIRNFNLLSNIDSNIQHLFLQPFHGNITIIPNVQLYDYLHLTTIPTIDILKRYIHIGKLATWKRMSFIKTRYDINILLSTIMDQVLNKLANVSYNMPQDNTLIYSILTAGSVNTSVNFDNTKKRNNINSNSIFKDIDLPSQEEKKIENQNKVVLPLLDLNVQEMKVLLCSTPESPTNFQITTPQISSVNDSHTNELQQQQQKQKQKQQKQKQKSQQQQLQQLQQQQQYKKEQNIQTVTNTYNETLGIQKYLLSPPPIQYDDTEVQTNTQPFYETDNTQVIQNIRNISRIETGTLIKPSSIFFTNMKTHNKQKQHTQIIEDTMIEETIVTDTIKESYNNNIQKIENINKPLIDLKDIQTDKLKDMTSPMNQSNDSSVDDVIPCVRESLETDYTEKTDVIPTAQTIKLEITKSADDNDLHNERKIRRKPVISNPRYFKI